MPANDELSRQTVGAWVVHHGQKTTGTTTGAAEYPALDAAAKAASLLSRLSATEELSLNRSQVEALARAGGLNPKTELVGLLDVLQRRRLIDRSTTGDVVVLGVTSRGTLQHAADIFEEQEPSQEERASIVVAEISSGSPIRVAAASELIGDKFKFTKVHTTEFLSRAEAMTFVDTEGAGTDKLYFNGNLFRRNSIIKTKRVLDSLSASDGQKVSEVDDRLTRHGCVAIDEVERILGKQLLEKMMAAGMYDVNHVSNATGEYGFVTKPAAFHKFVDPMVDDAFDLAKALVAALTFGMTQSAAGRGRITMIGALLSKLIRGESVGPATAIGEDYRVLEQKGVIRVTKDGSRYRMRLLKKDIGEIALNVLTTGDAGAAAVLDRPLPGSMSGYVGPEKVRTDFRKKQTAPSRRMTQDVLNALRTEGGL
jgi:hypothetical protein